MRLNAARLLPSTLAAVFGFAGCGNEAAERPVVQIGPDAPVERVSFPRVGAKLTVPAGAPLERRRRPGVLRLSLGEPFISVFAYKRTEQIPRSPGELKAARRRLIGEVERRGRTFELRSSRLTEVAGAKAIELVGDQTILGGSLRTRSVHVYKRNAEYVFELLAPPRDFDRLERDVFDPLLRSLSLSGKLKPVRKPKKKQD